MLLMIVTRLARLAVHLESQIEPTVEKSSKYFSLRNTFFCLYFLIQKTFRIIKQTKKLKIK